jgi:hypothetical protein
MTTQERQTPGANTSNDAWAVHAHLVRHLGMPVGMVEMLEPRKPRPQDKRLKVDVAAFSPMGPGSTSLLVTVGGCNKVMPNTSFAELFLLVRPGPDKDQLLELALFLRNVVRIPWASGTSLQPGLRVPLEDPPHPLAAFSHLLVTEPRTFKPGFGTVVFKGLQKTVDLLWLVPIHDEENAYAARHGADALLARWGAQQVDVAVLSRPPALLHG